MRCFDGLAESMRRGLLLSLIVALVAGLPGVTMARGGSGGGGSGGSGSGGGGHGGGEGIEDHGGRHGGGDRGHRGGRHGTIVRDIPRGHIELEHRGNHFFFHEGRFFSRHRDGFIVISAPIGIVVPSLPDFAVILTIGGITYYAADDNYYRRIPDGFVVVESPHH